MTSVLKVEKASVTYLEGTPFVSRALNNVDLVVNHGEIVGLIGSTGSGKSTLLQAINRLVDLSEGKIVYPEGYNEKQLFKSIGLVFQQPEDQLFERTVFEDVAFGPLQLSATEEDVYGRVSRALSALGLSIEKYGHLNPLELSGGEKRRVAIAGILSMEPEFLILDEPTAGLDQKGRDLLLSAISNLHSKLNITIMVVSHDLDMLARLCNRLIVLHEGKIVKDGSSIDVLSDSIMLSEAGLRPPDTIDIQNKLSLTGIDTGSEVILDPHVLAKAIIKSMEAFPQKSGVAKSRGKSRKKKR